MQSWLEALKQALVSGSVASLGSTLVLALAGRHENGSAAAPTNATSHWLWGESATRVDRTDWRHTALGYGIHHACSVFWAVFYERYRARPPQQAVLRDAAITAALACLVDYTITPPRLKPGFEKRLSRPALAAVYVAFGLGLAAASAAGRGAQRRSPR